MYKRSELRLLGKYGTNSNFIIETGSGVSTQIFSQMSAAIKCVVYSINVKNISKRKRYPHVNYVTGWSMDYNDLIKSDNPKFIKSSYDGTIDESIAYGHEENMIGERDLIRKIIKKEKPKKLDFFFCDTGEYCGLAEWNIVKNEIIKGGIFAAHDIYYPKSIKCFQVLQDIENSDEWNILVKTNSPQGLLIAERR